ncbi:MAG: hypothetical protein QOH39_1944 [Verrucomicrobiota bacterium]|jgi:hypothetical protein
MLTRFVTALVSVVVVISPLTAKESEADRRRADDYERRLAGVDRFAATAHIDTRRSIGEFDAYLLAWAYFLSHISGCGFPELPRDAGDYWVAQTRVGIAGQPGPEIIIEKAGGATHSPGKPKVRRPKDFARFAKNI